ncbi:ABC transporter permease [Actinoplanes couchii]|uniref:ABC transporter permease n=1 Tax=Actinoplanes couchii TaxID=403638 RepID=A0ABQ3X8J2_9ACTN|nr:ABC transporter permease [Actinoplanes couchii]MDR6320160.1 ABC-2 type transport system permease protein [Actinoplanes couchii]GID54826.1 ABC transporter permease [Actinoplanes couchii]
MTTDSPVRLTMPRLIAAEWLKLRTLRSFWACVVAAPVLAAGGAAASALSFSDPDLAGDVTARDAVTEVLASSSGVLQIALVVLAVVALSCEYTGGAIRVTLVGVPRRLSLVAAKAVVVTVVATLLAGLSIALGYAAALPLLHQGDVAPLPYGTMQALFGVEVGYCVLVALFAFAVTLTVRNTAAGVGLVLGAVLLLRVVLFMFDPLVRFDLQSLAFSTAATQVWTDPLSRALPVVAAWLLIPAVAGAVNLIRRDA